MIEDQRRMDDFNEKVNMVLRVIEKHKADGLLLLSQRMISWLTGARGFINIASTDSVFRVLITNSKKIYLIVNNIESLRIVEEELQDIELPVAEFPWYDLKGAEKIVSEIMGSHSKLLIEQDVEEELVRLQYVLSNVEQNLMRVLSAEVAMLTEQTLMNVKRGQTEFEVAGEVAKSFLTSGIEPIVLLAAADERAMKRRHPLPTTNFINHYLLFSACGRRHGLVASVTRTLSLDSFFPELVRRHRSVGYVDATAIAASIAGASLGDIFAQIQMAYATEGFGNEWKLHHQGGISGYASRMVFATPNSTFKLADGMVATWNPSISGVKSEDTCLVSSNGIEVLTVRTGSPWPMYQYSINGVTVTRPGILRRTVFYS